MKIRSQFIICIVIFSTILIVIAASVAITDLQVNNLNNQEQVSSRIENSASSLNTVAIDYFLYQEDVQLSRWQTLHSSLHSYLSGLDLDDPQQKNLINSLDSDLHDLNQSFVQVVSYLQSAPRNVSVRIDPRFQTVWSSMGVKSESLVTDASQLSRSISEQISEMQTTNTLLIVFLLATSGALIVTVFFIVFLRTLKSVTELKSGIAVIGSGNLDHIINSKGDDEVSELSVSFNQMTTKLKAVTASKDDLEKVMEERKKAEAAVRESEKRFRSVLDNASAVIYRLNLQTNQYEYTSPAVRNMGFEPEELTSMSTQEVFSRVHPEDLDTFKEQLARIHETGKGTVEYRFLGNDGKYRWWSNQFVIIKDEIGRPLYRDGFGIDITKRKNAEDALQQSEERFRLALRNAPVSVAAQDCNLRYTWAFNQFGATPEEIIGKLDNEIFNHIEAKYLDKVKRRVLSEDIEMREQMWFDRPFGRFYLDVTWSPIHGRDGQVIGVASATVDLTQMKLAEEARAITQQKLEENAVILEEYANQMEDIAEKRAQQLKDAERLAAIGATAGMVGHDIRNPLQAIIGDIYFAKKDLVKMPDSPVRERIRESITSIESSVGYINKIVQDLQDYARPIQITMQKTNLEELCNEVLFSLNDPGISPECKVQKSAQTIQTDVLILKRILTNLSSNAVQAMPKGGNLALRAHKEENDIIITVTDTGVGIPNDIADKLFTPMFTTKAKGQGFGLAVVKRMTEALGGSVTFSSEVGKGTVFTIRLPQN